MFEWSSYKSQVFTTLASAVAGVVSWGLLGTYRDTPVPQYNTNYASFLITGILVANLVLPLSNGLINRLSPWTIETVLMTGLKGPTYVIGSSAWGYLLSVLLFSPQLFVSVYLFHLHLVVNILSLLLSLAISTVIIFSLGMIATGMRLVTKVTDPITWSVIFAAQLLAGMTFPIQHLNDYLPGLSNVSWILPQTWIYHLIRLSTLDGASVFDPELLLGLATGSSYAMVLLVLSGMLFRWGLNRAKREGTIGWY